MEIGTFIVSEDGHLVDYFAVGVENEHGFCGIVHANHGGANYAEGYMFGGEIVPDTAFNEDIPNSEDIYDSDEKEDIVSNLFGDPEFITKCWEKLGKFTSYDGEEQRFILHTNIEVEDEIVIDVFQKGIFEPPNYGNRVFREKDPDIMEMI